MQERSLAFPVLLLCATCCVLGGTGCYSYQPPTAAQLGYARGAARRQGLIIPAEALLSKVAMTGWLGRYGDYNRD